MSVEGTVDLYVKLELINGRANKSGKYKQVKALVSSSLDNEIFLAWGDLIKLCVIKSNFPEVTTDEFVSKKTVSKEEP